MAFCIYRCKDDDGNQQYTETPEGWKCLDCRDWQIDRDNYSNTEGEIRNNITYAARRCMHASGKHLEWRHCKNVDECQPSMMEKDSKNQKSKQYM
jgi:hypothetical protein